MSHQQIAPYVICFRYVVVDVSPLLTTCYGSRKRTVRLLVFCLLLVDQIHSLSKIEIEHDTFGHVEVPCCGTRPAPMI